MDTNCTKLAQTNLKKPNNAKNYLRYQKEKHDDPEGRTKKKENEFHFTMRKKIENKPKIEWHKLSVIIIGATN